MVENTNIKNMILRNIEKGKISGAVLIVRKNGNIVCDAQYGYADMENKIEMKRNSIFRLASMTKPVIAIAVMLLEEEGKLCIDDPIAKYLPAFGEMKAAESMITFMDFYKADPNNPTVPQTDWKSLENVTEVKAKRMITIRDILCHSSGIGQGPVSVKRYEDRLKQGQSLQDRINIIADTVLDFQPGEATGYSASMAYEVLGRIIEIVSGIDLNRFIVEKIGKPLGIRDLGYVLSEEQKSRMVCLYEEQNGSLQDVSESDAFWKQVNPLTDGYFSGSAGLLGTMEAYDQIVQMIAAKGKAGGAAFLRPDTVERMSQRTEGTGLEMSPGQVWGLSMAIVTDPEKTDRKVGSGTYGWSGAFGTHFYIDPEKNITVVFGANTSNIGGAGSVVSRELEEVIYQNF